MVGVELDEEVNVAVGEECTRWSGGASVHRGSVAGGGLAEGWRAGRGRLPDGADCEAARGLRRDQLADVEDSGRWMDISPGAIGKSSSPLTRRGALHCLQHDCRRSNLSTAGPAATGQPSPGPPPAGAASSLPECAGPRSLTQSVGNRRCRAQQHHRELGSSSAATARAFGEELVWMYVPTMSRTSVAVESDSDRGNRGPAALFIEAKSSSISLAPAPPSHRRSSAQRSLR